MYVTIALVTYTEGAKRVQEQRLWWEFEGETLKNRRELTQLTSSEVHMPYCPKCKYEYRPEITKCPDCGQLLVERLPDQGVPDNLVCVATCPFIGQAEIARLQLESAGITSYLQNEIMSQADTILVFADGGIRIMVVESDAEKAADILAKACCI